MTNTRPLDPSPWDEAVAIADDLNHRVNGRWLADNPVPAEYPMWGAYLELDHRSKELTHRLLAEAAAEGSAGRGDAVSRLAGDCFAAGMDEGAIAAAGVEPLRPGRADPLRRLRRLRRAGPPCRAQAARVAALPHRRRPGPRLTGTGGSERAARVLDRRRLRPRPEPGRDVSQVTPLVFFYLTRRHVAAAFGRRPTGRP